MKILKMAEIDAYDLFENDNNNWKYCMNCATFHHASDDNCEFIIYLPKDDEVFESQTLENMKYWNCTQEFIDTCLEVRNENAEFVLFFC